MSDLKPDIFSPEKKLEDFYINVPDNSFKQEIIVPVEKIPLETFLKQIDDYAAGYDGDEKELYKYSLISAKIRTDDCNSIDYLNMFSKYLIITLKKTNPSKNFDNFEEFLEKSKIELEKILKDDNISNELYLPCILGIYRGLVK